MSIQPIHSVALPRLLVRDCMHPGVLTCGPGDSLQQVAGIMANHRVHAVVIMNSSATCAVGVISDLDVVSAVAAGADCSAREAAATEPLTVMADESLPSAAQRMSEHGVSHLVVLDSAVGHPVGILSTLDIAAAYANA